MTRTPPIILTVALMGLAGLALHARADDAAPPPKDPPAAAPAPADADRPPAERIADRMRQRREAMRDGEGRPGPGPDGPLQGPGFMGPPLTSDQQKQAMSVLREINPDLAEKIAEAQKTNPDRAAHILQRLGAKLLDLAQLQTSDPDLYKLKVADQRFNFETFRMIRQLRDARADGDDAKVQRINNRLREMLNKHFDVRTKLREHELAMLENRIRDLREELKDHHDRKQQLIDEQIQRLTSDTPPPAPPSDDDDKPQPQ